MALTTLEIESAPPCQSGKLEAGVLRRGSRELSQDEIEVMQPRSRVVECLIASLMGIFVLVITVWLLLGIIVPLVWHDYAWIFKFLLGCLSVLAFLSSIYIFQIGWGAYQWAKVYKSTRDENWYAKWKEKKRCHSETGTGSVKDWFSIRHFAIVTAYKEPIDMLRLCAYAMISQRTDAYRAFCRTHIVLVLAMEEREGNEAREKAETLRTELGAYFCGVIITYHPSDLPGDIRGKASNYKWAVAKVEDYIRSEDGQNAGFAEEDCIIHVADADSLYDPNFFPSVTYHYCVDPMRNECVYQSCMIPTCNLWELSAPVRQLNIMIAAQEMMSAYHSWEFQVPFSTYGLPLQTLQAISCTGNAADAQDGDVICEDHHLFIRGFYALGGRLRVQPIFLPCLNFSVGGEPRRCLQNVSDRFTQAKRHMFGVSELIYMVSLFSRGRLGWFCRHRRILGWRGIVRTLGFMAKLFKIHFLPYTGLWLLLGVLLMTILKADKIICEMKADAHTDYPMACDFALARATETYAMMTFTFTSTLSIIGGLFIVYAFAQMLKETHHTLMHIADPRGPFMPSIVWDGDAGATAGVPSTPSCERPVQRPVAVGGGFPWLGVVLQLILECLVFSFMTTIFFASLPASIALVKNIFGGHRMEYITAAKPGTSQSDPATADRGEAEVSANPAGVPLNSSDREPLR